MFSEIARQTYGIRCNNTSVRKSLPQRITTDYMKSKLKTENVTCIKTCPTTVQQRDTTKKKNTPINKSQILSSIISNNICNNLQHFDNDIIVQVDNGNTKKKQIQRARNVRRSQSIQTKSRQISSPSKSFHSAPLSYLPGTCLSRRFYSNPISKSSNHLTFTVTLSFTYYF